MKTLNDYGKDVMDAQTRLDAIDTDISKSEAALASLKEDRINADRDLDQARKALTEAVERVNSGDYGVTENGIPFEIGMGTAAPTTSGGEWMEAEAFEGINRAPPEDEPDYQLIDNRTLASNGAGF